MYFEIKKFRGWFDWLSTLILITIYGYNVEKLDRSNDISSVGSFRKTFIIEIRRQLIPFKDVDKNLSESISNDCWPVIIKSDHFFRVTWSKRCHAHVVKRVKSIAQLEALIVW